ncbi:hypothetical protein SSX86_000710 [Deinandra increscens subsp. villosa]|uniref:Uncharacterized protein n=1 Tax=Deinandra increscens subsp. villosa TaxID=3103831 RepID=A0AAP0DQD5_9ASTR
MAASQMPLLLLTILTLTSSISAIPTIYDIAHQFGFPSGILPDSVTSYSTLPADDGESFNFVVFLDKPCYVEYDDGFLVYFDYKITGKITYGKITELKGLQGKKYLFWLTIEEIEVDGSSLKFTQYWPISVYSDIALFERIPTCKDKSLASCGGRSSHLISQLPVIAE